MTVLAILTATILCAAPLTAQAAPQVPGVVPTLEDVRKGMGIPSLGDLRGQQDTVGFASRAEQMAQVWKLAETGPTPERFGVMPAPGVLGAMIPHDDYLFAGRMYRQMIPLITARTVVLVGVFHKYRRFGAKDRLVFDPYRAWRSPDGEIKISGLRAELLKALPADAFSQDAASHDSEHSLEAIAYWLKHQRPEVEILPILLPSASFERLHKLADNAGKALAEVMQRRGLRLGKDVAIVISSDGIHYGADFKHTPFGAGGVEAYQKAMAVDRNLLTGPLAGPVATEKTRAFYTACVNPAQPDEYRLPWCGRFSIPFGMLLLQAMAQQLNLPAPVGIPVVFGSSVDTPELPVKALGMGATAPANLYHFVSYPGVAFVAGEVR
ncbi:MAG: AmmeMemoRadiSam system protein B [Holophaga sp.]|nr:AmmeMemoRadiSam system protein B [Holophaga sp.]